MATAIDLDGICKRYGTVTALRPLTMHINAGQLVAVVGPSGCGKTTLLRLLAGFFRPDAGQILFNGQPVQHLPPERRPTSLVFQNFALWPHKTVFENIAFGLKVRRWQSAAIAERVEEMLALVNLSAMAQRYPGQISGGQQQRVALARSLAISPEVLLLDEPLSNLDAQIRQQMREELRSLQQRLGITTLYVTHDQEEALSVADELVVMQAGQIEQTGTPYEVYDRPATPFVARFIGQSNLLHGTIVDRFDGKLTVTLDDVNDSETETYLKVPSTRWMEKSLPRSGQSVVLAIKPEHVHLSALCDSGNAILRGSVQSRRFLGTAFRLTIHTQFGTFLATVSGDPDKSRLQDTVGIQLDPDHVSVFASKLDPE